ncbi:MAG: 4Fe-4S ferredoxin [Nitrospirae bacterium CG22_combo_CG10-13_8_21_14_all_44_11]|nr:MAG: 4Fe-4S ferredoxin [Nitrospirae bacterium CG1_02_44_142]PIP69858.1 MAG: 4Fe-4S ferredoxin [Nitrospirae bacterium CG22_combo_CG10-13_8_21_14_all_44_11]PIV40256.1 MAG: 4Fe-4S ferredoxin [Nitrospirae bacterium CG02_land_8_20_14_3_00_44_33]PIV66207.1 MAG: 4Fe-4S ferredoxin [Nitrospirae bacterium CG01_land_8_20_14_3_00_44_22]PIW88616.1 MAG: 4Fe-4S ferredoxin [Nitrospirae bacterium CG_4_8_14_3_um_filter_44_28]PJA82739.1 MAG: 4Fe-4S ferredoxin [Nitrospirae bacterium CG_4_9_14_3_um_filter_44_28
MSKVYFASARIKKWKYADSMPGKLERLFKEVNLSTYFEKDEWVAVKTHFGSEGAHRIVRPVFLRKVVDALKGIDAKPFVTDTVRIKGLAYLEVANQNGINHLSVGAPVVLADGLYGNDNIMVKAGEIIGEIAVASLIYDVPAMVVCSHIKGHIQAGYAGAIKNVAMGGISSSHRHCGWKCGRGAMHTIGEGKLIWDEEKCELCLQCEEICPLEVIKFENEQFTYREADCWRCGRCARVCPEGALTLPGDDERFMKALAETAKAVLSTFKPNKVIYINFLTEIQPECDCMPAADVPVIQDQGILISDDIVAIEQAAIDMLLKAKPLPQSAASELGEKTDNILYDLSKKPYLIQIEEAGRLGLGSRQYELIEI